VGQALGLPSCTNRPSTPGFQPEDKSDGCRQAEQDRGHTLAPLPPPGGGAALKLLEVLIQDFPFPVDVGLYRI